MKEFKYYIYAGYYARVKGIRVLLDQFLSQTECNCQVINLGAGFDSLFWLLKVNIKCSLLNCYFRSSGLFAASSTHPEPCIFPMVPSLMVYNMAPTLNSVKFRWWVLWELCPSYVLRWSDCERFFVLFCQLKEEGLTPKLFIEVDFGNVTGRKCYSLRYISAMERIQGSLKMYLQ